MAFDPASVLFVGMHFVEERMVNDSDTAAHYGSHQLGHLIASPAYVGLMIDAAVKAVEHRLPEGYVTVGHAMEFTHDLGFGVLRGHQNSQAPAGFERLLPD